MRRFLILTILFSSLFLLLPQRIFAIEFGQSFHSDITVNQDTSLTIKETIIYQTDLYKHGIYRYIPIRYSVNGLNQSARVQVQSVVNEDNRPHQYELSKNQDNVTLKIGDPDTTFTGTQTYVITYKVDNALQQYENHDELYWDITGEGWNFPLRLTSVTLNSPFAKIAQLTCYSGEVGSDDQGCRSTQNAANQAVFAYGSPITYGKNVTIVVGFNRPNDLVFPSQWDKAIQSFWDNFPLLLVALPGILMLVWWWKKGRDTAFISPNVFNQDKNQPTSKVMPFSGWRAPMVYEPLKDLTPGEAGTMLDESSDDQDVVAEILELARKKFLKIERTEKKRFLGTDVDYLFTQLKPANDKLPTVQKYLQEQLFAGRESVKLSKLKGTFYTKMAKAKDMLYQNLTERELFVSHPKNTRVIALVVAAVMDFLAFFLLTELLSQGLFWAIPLFIFSVVVGFICAWSMSAKTAVGRNLALQALGLQETINNGRWRQEIQEKHLFIENIFPFAVAFGVVQKLARDMEALKMEPPSYVSNIPAGMAFNSWVSDFTTQATSNMSYNPSSSSRSGSSGFSGGSSGGGGGGGGGGSW